jgi:hypothetical protein
MDQLVRNISEAVQALAGACMQTDRDIVPKTTFSYSGLLKRHVNPSKSRERLLHNTFAYCVYAVVRFNNNMVCEEF